MPKIVVLVDYYLPGYESGGPVRSISNMVDRLGDQFEFFILTRDRDRMDLKPYHGIRLHEWNRIGKAKVYYVSGFSLGAVRQAIGGIIPDIIYLNSFFSLSSTKVLILRWLGLLPNVPIILAPRGEFSKGALRLKAHKKRAYIGLALKSGFYRDLIWHASTPREKQEIQRVVGNSCKVYVAANISPRVGLYDNPSTTIKRPEKVSGQVRLAFLSRISPKKNLQFALETLQVLSGRIILHVYGPLEDKIYWQKCEGLIARLPDGVQVAYCGSVPHERVPNTLSQYHFFLLPTLGENFGFAILEALAAGCPVVISDQTPWFDLETKNIGWNLPLDDLHFWRTVLQRCVDMDDTTYGQMSQAARQFAMEWMCSPDLGDQTVILFEHALGL